MTTEKCCGRNPVLVYCSCGIPWCRECIQTMYIENGERCCEYCTRAMNNYFMFEHYDQSLQDEFENAFSNMRV